MKWINDITTEHQKLLEEMLTIIRRIYTSNRFFDNKPNEICSHLSEKAWKDRFVKVARYSFSASISPKSEHKLRRHKQRFGKIASTIVLINDENRGCDDIGLISMYRGALVSGFVNVLVYFKK